ncbi:hypothetical protein PUN28_011662 [Cardiocondyla obscurior]|uniref:Uncharacterized protein n=1 Tax=Cardiocondyla obscurior TaxID=286306 RepID=A0AAW2FKI5_9HYME
MHITNVVRYLIKGVSKVIIVKRQFESALCRYELGPLRDKEISFKNESKPRGRLIIILLSLRARTYLQSDAKERWKIIFKQLGPLGGKEIKFKNKSKPRRRLITILLSLCTHIYLQSDAKERWKIIFLITVKNLILELLEH